MNIIKKLRRKFPAQRAEIIEELYKKNRSFFSANAPDLYRIMEQCAAPFRIDMTDKFLDIVDLSTNALCHPEIGLDRWAEKLAEPLHEAWVELLNLTIRMPSEKFKHGQLVARLFNTLEAEMPNFPSRTAFFDTGRNGNNDGYLFSPPVIFLGIFHGLHVVRFLERFQPLKVMFIEPEPERFIVSCYFLDYAELYRRFPGFHLCIGPEGHELSFREFFAWHNVTSQIWTRILLGYASSHNHFIVEQLAGIQKTHHECVRPFDPELEGLSNAVKNIKRGEKLLTKKARLSDESCVAIVAPGPSLEKELEWLRDNQDKMIIFAVHGAVKILAKHGVRPDFQCSIDIHLSRVMLEQLALIREMPLITICKIGQELFEMVDEVYLVESDLRSNPVKFRHYIRHIYPTSGNLATGTACYFQPAMILLIGMDMGFHSWSHRHARGGFYGKGSSANHMANGLKVKANFDDNGFVYTTSYLNDARHGVEAALALLKGDCKVYNLSDGARIAGALPTHSNNLALPRYLSKERDITLIRSAFQGAAKGKNWESYKMAGPDLINLMKQMVLEGITMPVFDFERLSYNLDEMFVKLVERFRQIEGGERTELYLKFMLDLMLVWYRFLILGNDDVEREKIYNAALPVIEEIFEGLEWPE